jgi:regulator of protease activity HflC (stomatin/prohibitin superfamily)
MSRRDIERAVAGGSHVRAGLFSRAGCMTASIAGLVIAVAGCLLLSINTVPPGHVGVVVQLGQVQPYTLPPGVYFRPFLFQNVIDFETRVRPHSFREIDS